MRFLLSKQFFKKSIFHAYANGIELISLQMTLKYDKFNENDVCVL
jgi:hypothetical protein